MLPQAGFQFFPALLLGVPPNIHAFLWYEGLTWDTGRPSHACVGVQHPGILAACNN